MNWRAIGCGGLAAGVFVLVGILSILRVTEPPECPPTLPYEPAPYTMAGEPTREPLLEGVNEPLESAASFSFGLAAWPLWVEPGRAPTASGELLPQRIVLGCADGTFQAYQRGTE